MKICITSQGNTLESKVDPRFGRASYFIFYDDENSCFEAIENKNINATGGVGVQSGQLVAEKQAKIILTGSVGPNASQTLEAAGIKAVLGVDGTVNDAIDRLKNGELTPTKGPNADEKSGLKK